MQENKSRNQATIDWYNQNAEKYANTIAELVSPPQIKAFVEVLPPNATVLDAGCGAGRDSQALTNENLQVTGIDLSSGLIDEAKKRYPKLDFRIGNFLDLPFATQQFDGVWAHASLVHLSSESEVKQALAEFFRVLKTNGILHIYVKAQTGSEKFAVVNDAFSNHDRFFQYFSLNEISKLLADAGFKVLQLEQFKETDLQIKARPEVEWIVGLAQKQNRATV